MRGKFKLWYQIWPWPKCQDHIKHCQCRFTWPVSACLGEPQWERNPWGLTGMYNTQRRQHPIQLRTNTYIGLVLIRIIACSAYSVHFVRSCLVAYNPQHLRISLSGSVHWPWNVLCNVVNNTPVSGVIVVAWCVGSRRTLLCGPQLCSAGCAMCVACAYKCLHCY